MPQKSQQPRGRPFVKGDARAGRKKGVPNKDTVEVREAAAALVDDPIYREKLRADLRKRQVAPAVETMLWFYAKGKPVERHEIGTPGDYSRMSDAELDAAMRKALGP